MSYERVVTKKAFIPFVVCILCSILNILSDYGVEVDYTINVSYIGQIDRLLLVSVKEHECAVGIIQKKLLRNIIPKKDPSKLFAKHCYSGT